MKRVVTAIAVVAACLMGGGLIAGAMDLAPGSAVPDSVAADLHGGCAGVGEDYCWGIDLPCATVAYCNGYELDYDPGSIPDYYCFRWVNNEWVCATGVATYVSCASKGTLDPVGTPVGN